MTSHEVGGVDQALAVDVRVENLHQLVAEVEPTPRATYAFYLIHGKDVLERRAWSRTPQARFNLATSGRFTVRVYVRHPDGTTQTHRSDSLVHRSPRDPQGGVPAAVHVWGVGPQSIALALILQSSQPVAGLIDPDRGHVGAEVHGLPVLAPDSSVSSGPIIGVGRRPTGVADYEEVPLRGTLHPTVAKALEAHTAVTAYRLSRTLHLNGLTDGATTVKRFIHARFNSVIPFTAEIGDGTSFGYGGIGVVVHSRAVIGRNCKIGQNVTIGARGNVLPVIGDHVFIGANAVCVGGRIGNRVVVGSNAVVTREVPDDSVVAGIPATVIGSSSVGYDGYLGTVTPRE
ncbi:serine O-acetyltransferase [Knoellia subterranea]|uniref:Serine O-acetyltransferase n=1 Tax=Knoellia subterranea KCTC 19937 TaxID=1385521 RepID=A0A0A0JFY2_9MICO|nr:serine acetyltransferase [Knoellia subterranea]KGN35684.1 hypothetical protein N803_06335 [Knoellia subterranea KCTC 19937]